MTNQDRTRFAAALGMLAEIFGEPITKPRTEAYFAALSDLTIEQVESAATTLAGSTKFFPKPVEFRETVAGTAQDQASVAWRTFASLCQSEGAYPSLQVTDGAMAYAIEEMGGWVEAQAKLAAASPEMERAYQKTFEQFYKLGQTRNAGAKYFIGTDEAHNRTQPPMMRPGAGGRPVEHRLVSQKVCLLRADKFLAIKMPFDLRIGQLTEESRKSLSTGGEALRPYLPLPAPAKIQPTRSAPQEMASPEEIAALKDEIAALAGGRGMRRRLLAAPESVTEGELTQ